MLRALLSLGLASAHEEDVCELMRNEGNTAKFCQLLSTETDLYKDCGCAQGDTVVRLVKEITGQVRVECPKIPACPTCPTCEVSVTCPEQECAPAADAARQILWQPHKMLGIPEKIYMRAGGAFRRKDDRQGLDWPEVAGHTSFSLELSVMIPDVNECFDKGIWLPLVSFYRYELTISSFNHHTGKNDRDYYAFLFRVIGTGDGWDAWGIVTADEPVKSGQKYHIVGGYSAKTEAVTLWLDGKEAATTTLPGDQGIDRDFKTDKWLGWDSHGNGRWDEECNRYIRDVRYTIYSD